MVWMRPFSTARAKSRNQARWQNVPGITWRGMQEELSQYGRLLSGSLTNLVILLASFGMLALTLQPVWRGWAVSFDGSPDLYRCP